MMRFNIRLGPVRTQITNTQKMNDSEMNTKNIRNLHVCSSYKSKLNMTKEDKRLLRVCSADKKKPKRVIDNACYLDGRESKTVHISINTSEVKDATNETKDEEPLVIDNSVINAPIYIKIFKCGKTS